MLQREANVLQELTRKAIFEEAEGTNDHFTAVYQDYETQYAAIHEKIEHISKERQRRREQTGRISAFMFKLHEYADLLTTFDPRLWIFAVERVLVKADGTLRFELRNGQEIEG